MEEPDPHGNGYPTLPTRLFERLAQLHGYTFDQSTKPFHSSYDNWHVFGIQHGARETSAASSLHGIASSNSNRSSPRLPAGPAFKYQDTKSDGTKEVSPQRMESERTYISVVARISYHVFRIEREYHLNKSFIQISDPDSNHTIRPTDLIKLPGHQDGSSTIAVSIFESPGRNYLQDLLDFEAAWSPRSRLIGEQPQSTRTPFKQSGLFENNDSSLQHMLPLATFLDFAIGASECLELLHHGLRVVHGEIRGDAFYFNQETGAVKIINFGSGPRSFENGLTSAGWLMLSREVGIKNKLQFIAPEQTGRMPAEPDSRTDIYSLGVLFWTMLTRQFAFDGETPLDIVQSVLGRRIPVVSSIRIDVPDAISHIIQKMTQKQIDERYHSISGLKHDLVQIQKILGDGDAEALSNFKIGSKDISSFFVLPSNVFGRNDERDKIVKVIEKVAKRQKQPFDSSSSGALGLHSNSASAPSEGRLEALENSNRSSDTSSQTGRDFRESVGLGLTPAINTGLRQSHVDSEENLSTSASPVKTIMNVNTKDFLEVRFSSDTQSSDHRGSHSSGQQNGSGALPRLGASQKFRRRSRCEVITVIGAAGLGKSRLIQNTQGEIRRSGYFASAKFDPARKAPFEPLKRATSSLFRQIFSESDLNSDYHNFIRANVCATWPSLCSMLDLPTNLIYLEAHHNGTPKPSPQTSHHKTSNSEVSGLSKTASNQIRVGPHVSSDFLRGNKNTTQSPKFMNIFLDVLRILSGTKLICLCFDDLQYGDEESLNLISNIILRKLGIVLIITCREEQMIPAAIKSVIDIGSSNLTKITLAPLNEHEVIEYVAATLYRSEEYCIPLAIVCLERTNGNPFYLRQMLELCHRKGCLWYSWKLSAWEYDIDKVFSEFETQNYGHQLNTSFITKRLQDLPLAARTILAWASLLGNSFSFSLVQRLLSGEFDYVEDHHGSLKLGCPRESEVFTPQPIQNIVEGLQATLQSYILMPNGNDDQYCFSHDRYVQASALLRECSNVQKMHFIIVQTMMKYSNLDDRSYYIRAQHICQAAGVIKSRILHRRRFRELLFQAAQKAIESGARPTALQCYETCIDLMQPDPWIEDDQDVSYDETLSVYTKAAELYWHQGRHPDAEKLLESTFKGARSAADRAPSWVLRSRIYAARGNVLEAFKSLKASLVELGLNFESKPTWDTCDIEYKALRARLQGSDISELVQKPFCNDATTMLLGTVLTEAISAAYWSDSLLFYQMVVKMVDYHQRSSSTFDQSGLGFGYFSSVGITRFGDLVFGSQMSDISLQLLKRSNHPYTVGRGLAISTSFVAHMLSPTREHMNIHEEAIDQSLACGDMHVFLFSVGSLALCKLSIGADMAELETFCNVAPEDFGEWANDLRGGVLLTAVRQVARSLQGKTWSISADTVMSDEHHSTLEYTNYIKTHASNIERPLDLYNSLLLIPLYLFGHYDKAIQVGSCLTKTMNQLWSIRNSRITLFFLSLSIIAKLRETQEDVNRRQLIEKVESYKAQIEQWQKNCDVNYKMWSLMVGGEMHELAGRYHEAIQEYEAAIDHTVLHDLMLDQALAIELQAGFYIRRGAKRAARSTMVDAIAIYSQIGATGKAEQLKTNHGWILRDACTPRTVDVGIQTESIGNIGNMQFRIEENERQETRNLGKETAGDRTNAWVTPGLDIENGSKTQDPLTSSDVSALGLDVLDLQSILEFNQAISSELQIDRLLAQMTGIILESAGAQADFAAVVIKGDRGWCIAASGTTENISSEATPLSEIQDETQKQVLLYSLRFRESVFVHNVANDDRFCNTPSSKSVISLPIIQAGDLLGVLYLEGQPNSFTDRNLGLLQLLCNQVGISVSNALLFKQIRKVSASNVSMIDSQKRALAKARDAEIKAKLAEAEAMENVRLKEEAMKAKSMFLANVSHELRTPLNGVIGMSELLKATKLDKEQDGFADSIRVCADTLLTVINDILDFSKLEAGKMKLFSVPLNLKETITEVVRALSYTNLERGLKTIEDLDLDPTQLVMGDPVRLHQVFMNLLSNSYKFTAKGSVTVKSVTEYEDEKEIRVTCSVIDTGIGISQEQVTRLFKPFSQADSSTQRSYGGSGLGLSICKALVNVLNGKIWLESRLGVGTTVSFTLTFSKVSKIATTNNTETSAREPDPMATWSSDALSTSPRTLIPSFFNLSQIPHDQLRICIAEDNPINQKIAVSYVTKLGIKCEAFTDGLQAVEALRRGSREQQPFQLVLMDVQMPIMDGYDATRLIRKDDDPAVRGVIIIAMTASAIRGDREKCLQAGMNNYLAKPVRAAVLKSMLEEYCNQLPSSRVRLNESPPVVVMNLPLIKRSSHTKRLDSQNNDHSSMTSSSTNPESINFSPADLTQQTDADGVSFARPMYDRDDSEKTITQSEMPDNTRTTNGTINGAINGAINGE